MSVPILDDYTKLIPSQHASKPKFMSTLGALIQPVVDVQNVLDALASNIFDLDTAIGVQLDKVGVWIGRSREVLIPISGVYFSFDTAGIGFDQGSWQGPFDALSGLTYLDDTTYRSLLRAKIIMNSWDGTAVMASQAIKLLFSTSPGTYTTIQDSQDMSMIVGVSGVVPPVMLISLLQNDEFNVNPVGVAINYVITSINTTALFGFDIETSAIAGFDVGSWSGQPGSQPGQVTSFILQSTTSNSATFAWLAPSVGIGPYTYQVQYRVMGSTGAFTLAPVTSNTSLTISGLSSAQSYTAQIYAVSSSGAGPTSNPISFATLPGIPGQVTGLIETAVSTTSITIAWAAVAGAVNYQALYRVSGTLPFTVGPTTALTNVTISGLVGATIYDVTVYATNASGSGANAALLTIGTTGSVPGAVTSLTVGVVGQTDIAISWLNPVTGNGPFAFNVRYALNGPTPTYQQFTGAIALSASGGSCDIVGLNSGVAYLIQVAASNLGGSGPYGTTLLATTLFGPPNQVTNLVATPVSSTSVTLSWSAVVNAVQYQVQLRVVGTTVWINSLLVTAPTVSATLTGLIAGDTYQFRVYAIGP